MGIAVHNTYPVKGNRRENAYDILAIIDVEDELIKALSTCKNIISCTTNNLIIPTSSQYYVIASLCIDLIGS